MNYLKIQTLGALALIGIGGAWFVLFDQPLPGGSSHEMHQQAAVAGSPDVAVVNATAAASSTAGNPIGLSVQLTPLNAGVEQLEQDEELQKLLRRLQLGSQQQSAALRQLVGVQRQAAMLRRSSNEHAPLLLGRLREFARVSLSSTLNDDQLKQLFESSWLESLFTPNER